MRDGVTERPVVPWKPGNAGVEGRGLGSRLTQDVVRDRRLGMTLATPSSIQKLQMALHAKAKEAPEYRFYLLYDKVYRGDVLQHAYACCKANKGGGGSGR